VKLAVAGLVGGPAAKAGPARRTANAIAAAGTASRLIALSSIDDMAPISGFQKK
jgi:hypothetical protein